MLSQAELGVLRDDPDLRPLFTTARVVPTDREGAAFEAASFAGLLRELGWSMPGRRAALRSTIEALFVMTARHALVSGAPARRPGRRASLVARFRERIDGRLRLREAVGTHAAALGVSKSALRAACVSISGVSPAAMLDERTVLEARRSLLYSHLSIAEISWALGFSDSAYFSRFSARHAGQPPAAYRRSLGRTGFDADQKPVAPPTGEGMSRNIGSQE